jgi:hypothetical protein
MGYTKRLLEQREAAEDQRRSRASLVDEAIIAFLQPRYSDVTTRLDKLLGPK